MIGSRLLVILSSGETALGKRLAGITLIALLFAAVWLVGVFGPQIAAISLIAALRPVGMDSQLAAVVTLLVFRVTAIGAVNGISMAVALWVRGPTLTTSFGRFSLPILGALSAGPSSLLAIRFLAGYSAEVHALPWWLFVLGSVALGALSGFFLLAMSRTPKHS